MPNQTMPKGIPAYAGPDTAAQLTIGALLGHIDGQDAHISKQCGKIRNRAIGLWLLSILLFLSCVLAVEQLVTRPIPGMVDPTLAGAKVRLDAVSADNADLRSKNADLVKQVNSLKPANQVAIEELRKVVQSQKDDLDKATRAESDIKARLEVAEKGYADAKTEAEVAKTARANAEENLVEANRKLAAVPTPTVVPPPPGVQAPPVNPAVSAPVAPSSVIELRSTQANGNQPKNMSNPHGLWQFIASNARRDLASNRDLSAAARGKIEARASAFEAACAGRRLTDAQRNEVTSCADNFNRRGLTQEAEDVKLALNSR